MGGRSSRRPTGSAQRWRRSLSGRLSRSGVGWSVSGSSFLTSVGVEDGFDDDADPLARGEIGVLGGFEDAVA